MRVFVPISGNVKFTEMCRKYPDRLGHIISPSYYMRPRDGVDFVLDNGAFIAWKNGLPFDESGWLKMLKKVQSIGRAAAWTVVPDVVCDKDATLRAWEKYSAMVEGPKAFVFQDGMVPGDAPDAEVYFIGGSDAFKWRNAQRICSIFPRVHVGRVRTRKLEYCDRIGAESCDGSGWLRNTMKGRQMRILEAWVMKCNHQYELL